MTPEFMKTVNPTTMWKERLLPLLCSQSRLSSFLLTNSTQRLVSHQRSPRSFQTTSQSRHRKRMCSRPSKKDIVWGSPIISPSTNTPAISTRWAAWTRTTGSKSRVSGFMMMSKWAPNNTSWCSSWRMKIRPPKTFWLRRPRWLIKNSS